MNFKRNILILNIVLPLIIGSIFYILYSPDVFFVKWINSFISIPTFYNNSLNQNIVFKIFRNYILDMLWAYSLSAVLMLITNKKRISLVLAGGFAILMEFCQYINIFEGTFDFFDIVCELIAIYITKYTIGGIIYEKEN